LSGLFFLLSCREKDKPVGQVADTYYTCSMHPQIMQGTPGKCPICGMELVLVKNARLSSGSPYIVLSDQQLQLGNIRVDTLGQHRIGDQTVLAATLNMDETKTVSVSSRIPGRIEKLYFKSIGDYIHKGDRLYDLYSEELNNAKQEYLLALEKQNVLGNSIVDFRQIVESSRNKLLLWGMTASQITELAKTKKHTDITSYFSSNDGYLVSLESHEGDYLKEGTSILRLANLSTIWAEAQVYTSQLSQIDKMSEATVRIPDLSLDLPGEIVFVNPEINPDTRINLLRVSIRNNGALLKPGMQAYVTVKNGKSNGLSIPTDAVIRNEKGNLVWVQTGHNTFKPVMVKTGIENETRIEIISGLKAGELVVTQGAYLLNSEYIIRHGTEPRLMEDMSGM